MTIQNISRTNATQSIRLPEHTAAPLSGHLKLGGQNPAGETIAVNSYYLTRNGKAGIPVMGEFHFSRYAADQWEAELLKIKAGGVNIVATYVLWIHIEENEGVFKWSGNRDLRRFIELCDKHGLDTVVRVGPFAHGECRNGGLPDWIYGRPFAVRSNDERYLDYARRFYSEIAKQIEGLYFQDGGSIIGIQLENEYMHCGAPWEVTFKPGTEWVPAGTEGSSHIAKLKAIAQDVGLIAPLYTGTGWLNSPIVEDEILPMQGGYVFQPWSPDPNYRQQPTREFIFRNRHLHPVLNGRATYDASRYPYACCEIGGGIQITYYHRPIVPPIAVEGLALMNLAGGANVIGYYMYHGGSNPVGEHAYLNEFTVPRISYDFQAPLGEFGQIRDSFGSLRLLHTFLRDFGDILAPMVVSLPENAILITPEDTTSLRWSVRSDEKSGFIFLNNYQDHVEMQEITDIQLRLERADGTLTIPQHQTFTLQKDVCAILPFGLSLNGIGLNYATTQLLTKIKGEDSIDYVFFAPHGLTSEYAFEQSSFDEISVNNGEISTVEGKVFVSVNPGFDCVITLTHGGKTIRILTLTRDQAERCTKQTLWAQERLIISDATLVISDEESWLYSSGQEAIELWVYPAIEEKLATPFGEFSTEQDGNFTRYEANIPQKNVQLDIEKISVDKTIVKFAPDTLENVDNVLLQIDYLGDIGQAFVNGKLIADNFYNGTTWEIGLREAAPTLPEMLITVTPITQNNGGARYVPTGMAFRPDGGGEYLCAIHSITAHPIYKIPIRQL
jgi:beta-galactosidase